MLGLIPQTPSRPQSASTSRACNSLQAPSRCGNSRSSHTLAPDRLSVVTCCSNTPEPNDQDNKTEELRRRFFNFQGQHQGPGAPGATGDGASGSQPSSVNRPPSPTLQRLSNADQPSTSGAADLDGAALDNVNPYSLGRQARKAFNQVWSQLSNLASPTKSFIFDDTLEPGRDVEFESPQAAYTTVLVVGATGRVGRVLTRKLLLRGYTVKALVRGGMQREDYALPAAVEVVQGDVGDLEACQQAVRGVNKVIFCAAARSTFTVELNRVEDQGVKNIVKALQDEYVRMAWRERQAEFPPEDVSPKAMRARRRLYSDKSKREIADFSQRYHQMRWGVTFVGIPEERAAMQAAAAAANAAGGGSGGGPQGPGLAKPAVDRWMASSRVVAEVTEEDHLIFEGQLYQRGAYAEVGAQLHHRLPGGDHRTKDTEAVTLRVRGDGNIYACVVTTRAGHSYIARFPTKTGFLNVRLPWASFRPEGEGQPWLEPGNISAFAIRYEARRSPAAAAASGRYGRAPVGGSDGSEQEGRFQLEVDWIKATPGGVEPDVILVSSARNALKASGQTELDAERIIAAKRRGENHLRLSGLGYTIIRPGQLVDEPGGYRTLVFDQGDRIEQPVSAADVADICLRALHEPDARNKTFDVCYEVASDMGSSIYELVTSVPDKSGQYLKQATSTLVKNT